ncbi:hypothetical protein [Henriciella aquimarina]|uniref:hypothetical protein n=1 Tax=Henriciella aquimarina TaxID=545261 RepID=UPI00117B63B1|nr:hypothetical protein [Henriciella aquimarina]
MLRLTVFLAGFILAAAALPTVLEHHARAEIMQLAWCSSSGGAGPAGTGFFGMHCMACPVLLGSIGLMIVSPFIHSIRRFALLRASGK